MNKIKETVVVIHHYPCPDGELAAAIFKQKYPNSIFIPWLHELKEETMEKIKEVIKETNCKHIYFLDYCPEFYFADELSLENNVTIIDHHKSACETFMSEMSKNPECNINFIFDNNKSGCQLTWIYCNQNEEYRVPVKHIGNKDIWVWTDPLTEPFVAGYNLYFKINDKMTAEERMNKYEEILFCNEDDIQKIIEIGNKSIEDMRKECIELLINVTESIDIDINGKELSLVEIPMTKYHLNKYLQELVQTKYPNIDVMRLKYEKENKNVFSLRSLKDDIRVDLLAQKYGGNGHYKASGYSINL